MTLPPLANVQGLTAEATTNDLGQPGIRISLDAESPSNAARLYRLEYEETYKVIAPFGRPMMRLFLKGIQLLKQM